MRRDPNVPDDNADNISYLKHVHASAVPEDAGRAENIRSSTVTRAKRRTRVLELRAAGLTHEEIALQMDMSPTSVGRVIAAQLEAWREEDGKHIEDVRAMKLYELDQLKKAIWAKALQGDMRAVREASKIIQQQARISGAEAPRQVETRQLPGLAGIDPAEIERMERAWIESKGEVDQVVDAQVVEETQAQLPLGIDDRDNLDDLGS